MWANQVENPTMRRLFSAVSQSGSATLTLAAALGFGWLRQRPAVGGYRVEAPGMPAPAEFNESLTSYKPTQAGITAQ
jgi:hypothetical protein